jgi:hypothetical protein
VAVAQPLPGAAEPLMVAVNKPAAIVSAVASYSRPYLEKLAHGQGRGKSIRQGIFDF